MVTLTSGTRFTIQVQALKGATAIFGGGIAHMIDDIIPGATAF